MLNIFPSLTGLQPSESMWGLVYGGGAKQLVRVTTNPPPNTYGSTESPPQAPGSPSLPAVDVSKQRVRLHIKLLQHIGSPASIGGALTQSETSSHLYFCLRVLFLSI